MLRFTSFQIHTKPFVNNKRKGSDFPSFFFSFQTSVSAANIAQLPTHGNSWEPRTSLGDLPTMSPPCMNDLGANHVGQLPLNKISDQVCARAYRWLSIPCLYQAGSMETLAPFPLPVVILYTSTNSRTGSQLTMPLNACKILTIVYATSVRARFWPGHTRGPPPKGR